MGKAVVISGTPGTGKSEVARKLANILNATYVNLSEYVIQNRLFTHYDSLRETYVIDEDALRNRIAEVIVRSAGYVVIDSHYGEIVPDEVLDKIFILRLNPKNLIQRLRGRGWNELKVKENVESELLGICTQHALEEHPSNKVCEVDVTGRSADEVVREIILILKGKKECRVFIDWLSLSDVSDVLEYIVRANYTYSTGP